MLTRSAPMKRTPFKAKAPEKREAKQLDYTPRPRPVVQAVAELPPSKPVLKTPEPWDQRIRQAAKGQECAIRIPGACDGRTDTTVWCHLPGIDGGRGMGFKSIDLCGAFGCFGCHNVVDGRAPLPAGASRTSVMLDFFHGHMRSLVILKQKGLV